MRERSFPINVGLSGTIALLALVANGLLNNRLPAAWIFATAIPGTLVIAAGHGGNAPVEEAPLTLHRRVRAL